MSYDNIGNLIISAYKHNRSQIERADIMWSLQTIENGFTRNRKIELNRTYRLWTDHEKITVESRGDRAVGVDFSDNTGEYSVQQLGERRAYDGHEFREMFIDGSTDIAISNSEPRFKLHENWFELAGWDRSILHTFFTNKSALDSADFKASFVRQNGRDLISIEFRSKTDPLERGVYFVDPARNYNLVRYDWYNKDNMRYATWNVTLTEVISGLWMASHIVTESFSQETGDMTLRNTYTLDLDQSKFNENAVIPDGIFTLSIAPDAEISDYRSGVRINYRTKEHLPNEHELDTIIDQANNSGAQSSSIDTSGPSLPVASNLRADSSINESSNLPGILFLAGAAAILSGVIVLLASRYKNRT